MKNILLAFLFVGGLFGGNVQAQKIAVVDLNGILENLPAFIKAQEELDKTANEWRQEIANEYDKINSMYNKFQAEQVLMSDEMKKQKEQEIIEKEAQVRELNRQKFGPEGALFSKRQELVQPIQEKVYSVIETYAKERAIDIILDKEAAAGILFVTDELDKTDDIKRRLNINR